MCIRDRPLKHHMLEEVGKTASPFRFGAEPHVVQHGNGNDGVRPVWYQDDPEAVVELQSLHGEAEKRRNHSGAGYTLYRPAEITDWRKTASCALSLIHI